jgi:hypothetical protein
MSGGPGTGGGGDCNPSDFQKLKPKMGKKFAEWLKKQGEEIHALKGGGHAAHRDFYYNKKTGEIFYAIKNNAQHYEPTYFTVQEVFGWAL